MSGQLTRCGPTTLSISERSNMEWAAGCVFLIVFVLVIVGAFWAIGDL